MADHRHPPPPPVPAARGIRLIVWGMVLAASSFSSWLAYTGTLSPQPTGGLVVDPADLDIGDTWDHNLLPWRFTIHNPTSKDVHISRFHTDCSCTSIEPTSLTIPARGSAPVVANLKLQDASTPSRERKDEAVNGTLKRPFAVRIAPTIDGAAPVQAGWRLTGQITPLLTASPRLLTLSDGYVRGQPFPEQKIHLKAHTNLRDITVTCPERYGRVTTTRTAATDDQWDVTFTLAPTLPAGELMFDLQITAVPSDQTKLPAATIPVRGHLHEDVYVFPPNLFLGVRGLGQTVVETIQLRSFSGKPFEVDRIREMPDQKAAALAPPAVPPGSPNAAPGSPALVERLSPMDHAYRITQPVRHLGLYRSTLLFSVHSNGRHFDVPLELHYHGTDAQSK